MQLQEIAVSDAVLVPNIEEDNQEAVKQERSRRISSNDLNDELDRSAPAVNAETSLGYPTFSVVKDLIHGSQSLPPSHFPRKRQRRISSNVMDDVINGSIPAVNNQAPSTEPHFSCLRDFIDADTLVDEMIQDVCAELQETAVSDAVLVPNIEEDNQEAVDDDNIQFIKEVMKKPKIDVIDLSSDEEETDSTTPIVIKIEENELMIDPPRREGKEDDSTEGNVAFKVKIEEEDEDVLMIEPPMKLSQRAALGNPYSSSMVNPPPPPKTVPLLDLEFITLFPFCKAVFRKHLLFCPLPFLLY
ncbi:hypothetical protein PRIPAC_97165 [Pristionchus pacificus]|uniref:Uncharacterized protein n=2 Tax=Pristionchus pacificus TaxID=54126 RepID=A0A2A6BDK2_PRIPA|nr:hypothetical protein PRIPAC_97165 [Pristionchus pacificus]|eukprot:PDM63954.1 hypothetical protein PRIPAC_49455 [Pristionchus pacificus]